MKLVGQKIIVDNPDTVRIIPEDADDLWVLCSHMAPGDVVVCETSRKVSAGDVFSKGGARVNIPVELRIVAVDFAKDSSSVRVKGKVAFGAAGGSFLSIDVVPGKELHFRKKRWDSVTVEALREACTRRAGADVAAILFTPSAATIHVVGPRVSTLCDTIDNTSGRGSSSGPNRFFEGVLRAVVKRVDFNTARCVVIGSSGAVKDEFRAFLLSEAQKKKMKAVAENKTRIVAVEATGLREALSDRKVMAMMKDTKTARDIEALSQLREMIRTDSERVCYGAEDVERAQEADAIETLMVTDEEYAKDRNKYATLVEAVKKRGGNTIVFSSLHDSGEQLAQLTGVAAILRFPLYDHY